MSLKVTLALMLAAATVSMRQSQEHRGSNLTRVLLTRQFNPGIIAHPIQAKSHRD